MSISDPEAEPVQPEEGQGEEAAGQAPYAEYLERIPEEGREAAEEAFKAFDANTTRKFQDASEYKKSWEPYEQLGVNQRDPEEVQWALSMLEAAKTNPQGVAQWYEGYAQQHNLTPQQEQQQAEPEYVDPSVQSLVDQRLQEYLNPMAQQVQGLSQWQQQQEQSSREQQAMGHIKSTWDEMKSKHGAEFNEPMVEKLLGNYIQSDPQHAIERAFQDWQSIRNQIEKDVLQQKSDAPAGAEAGGAPASTPNGTPEGVNPLDYAAEIAMEQLRANNSM